MLIYGLDFTSAPGRSKPIRGAACGLDGGTLHVRDLERFDTFESFEAFLGRDGPWVAGMDFPFGQPRKLVVNMGWPQTWAGYVEVVANQSQSIGEFVALLAAYRSGRSKGDKQHLRYVDELADARSPMMLYGVPVGRMFFQGASRLLCSGLSILPCRPTDDNRVVVEAYPRLVANRWIDRRQSYKNDDRRKQTLNQRESRQAIVSRMREGLRQFYGFDIALDDTFASAMVDDASGDTLDAVLCAVQAAWAYTMRDQNYGIPAECNILEGWIVDPSLLERSARDGEPD